MPSWFRDTTAEAIDRLTDEIRSSATWRARPVFGFVTLLYEDDAMLVYAVSALPPFARDVAERRLSCVVEGGEPTVTIHPADATALGEITVPRNAQVILSLVDVDDSGNTSAPAIYQFMARDTIAPPQPEGLSVTLIRDEVA